jgi:two-component system response regulator FlrC
MLWTRREEAEVKRILVVDDEEGIRTFIGAVLEGQGYKVTLARDGREAAEILERESFHLMITDLKMPRLDGMGLLRLVNDKQPEMEVIVVTAHGTVQTAVDAMKLGACDYLTKPLSGPDELRVVAARALERRELKDSGQRLAVHHEERSGMIAVDPAMLAVVTQLRKVAATDATVLLLGESGTGKEVAAQAIHAQSRRADGPFVAVNCAVLSEHLIESEMFGHEKGSFTGATAVRRGRFELADGGTLFLDEVAELHPSLQAKLLRVLEERSFERVGGTRTIEVDIRLVAATNRDLAQEISDGRLREDLYHRLAVFPVRLPPLRERRGDILPLAEYLLGRISRQIKVPQPELEASAQEALLGYHWPGNVRELANVLERASILAEGPTLSASLLGLGSALSPTVAPAFEGTLKDMEREAIKMALESTGGHRKKTADRLGIGLRTLYEKLKEYGLG